GDVHESSTMTDARRTRVTPLASPIRRSRTMNGTRILGTVCASILATSLGALAACGGSPESTEAKTAEAVNAASVSIARMDESGATIGDGSGVLIAPRLVLTSGHLLAGKNRWVVTAADGTTVNGSRAVTYDWLTYDSQKAHPR